MTILLLAGSPSIPSRSTRLLQHVGERLARLGHRYSKLHVPDLPAQALPQATNGSAAFARLEEHVLAHVLKHPASAPADALGDVSLLKAVNQVAWAV